MTQIRTMARDEFWAFAEKAKTEGKDLAEVLDRAGVLLTPARMARIRAEAFREVAELLEQSTPAQLMDFRAFSPLDLQNALARHLRALEARERKLQ